MPILRAALLHYYTGPCRLLFANGEGLEVGQGRFYTPAFGIALNVETRQFIATDKSKWKLG